jgi:hypothetical protein
MPLQSFSLRDLVEYVRNRRIDIPVFQREFIWSDTQIQLLAESIYKEYPAGLLILYEYYEDGVGKYLVLDGQQRILSVYMIYGNPVETYLEERRYVDIWFNPIEESFKASHRRPGPTWIKVSEILNSKAEKLPEIAEKVARETLGYDVGRILSRINNLWLRFEDYKFAAYIVPRDYELDELGEIFDRVNFAGTKIKSADILYSVVAIKNEEVGKGLRSLSKDLRDRKWDLDLSVLIRCFISILTGGRIKLANKVLEQASKLKEILEKAGRERLKEFLQEVNSSISNTIKFLSQDYPLAIKNTEWKLLLSQAPLVVISYILHKARELDLEQKATLAKWFILTQYHGRYSSAAETRLEEDLKAFNERGLTGLITTLRESIGVAILPEERDLVGSSRHKDKLLLLYSLLKFRDATDLSEPYEKLNSYFTIHHIFPVSRLEEQADNLLNITFVTENTNKELSNKLPEMYLRTIPEEILEKHLIPTDRSLWSLAKYDEFIIERRKLIKQSIDEIYREFR